MQQQLPERCLAHSPRNERKSVQIPRREKDRVQQSMVAAPTPPKMRHFRPCWWVGVGRLPTERTDRPTASPSSTFSSVYGTVGSCDNYRLIA